MHMLDDGAWPAFPSPHVKPMTAHGRHSRSMC